MSPNPFIRNMRLPEGTTVVYINDFGEASITKTTSRPWKVGNGRGAGVWLVSLEGKTGGYSLDRVHVFEESSKSPNVKQLLLTVDVNVTPYELPDLKETLTDAFYDFWGDEVTVGSIHVTDTYDSEE